MSSETHPLPIGDLTKRELYNAAGKLLEGAEVSDGPDNNPHKVRTFLAQCTGSLLEVTFVEKWGIQSSSTKRSQFRSRSINIQSSGYPYSREYTRLSRRIADEQPRYRCDHYNYYPPHSPSAQLLRLLEASERHGYTQEASPPDPSTQVLVDFDFAFPDQPAPKPPMQRDYDDFSAGSTILSEDRARYLRDFLEGVHESLDPTD